jgi:type I restriction enzyme S subunit
MVMSDLPNGRALARAFFVDGQRNLAVNQRVCALTAKKVDPKFLYYQMDRSPYFLMFDDGANQTHLTNNAYLKYPVLLPAESEQRAIASFLDRETGKIDRMIGKQERMIELLKEKRQAVISHAVTKGLNPNAPMKDSGIEWLGEIPEHWGVSALKFYWYVIDCKHLTAPFVDDGIPLASIKEVQSWTVNLSSAKQTTEHFYQLLIEGGRKPKTGDIIYSRNATVGEAALVTADHPKFSMGQDVCILKPQKDCSSEYYMHLLKSPVITSQLNELMVGATFKRINVENIRNFLAIHPPEKEQQAIAKYLDGATCKIDNLTAKAKQAIGLMKERRTALISAAVTGKIDVRSEA